MSTVSDIIVNTADESITDLANAVVVRDWHQGDLTDEDTVLYAEAHGKRLADLVAFVQKVARLTEARATAVDDLDGLIYAARKLI